MFPPTGGSCSRRMRLDACAKGGGVTGRRPVVALEEEEEEEEEKEEEEAEAEEEEEENEGEGEEEEEEEEEAAGWDRASIR